MSQSSYRQQLRSTTRLYWSGLISRAAFESSMFVHVQTGFADAFSSGQREAGIKDDERTFQENLFLQMRTTIEQARIPMLADFISARSENAKFPYDATYGRVVMWANRWLDMSNSGKQMAHTDPLLTWELGNTEKSCASCLALNGKTKRATQWREANIEPQSQRLRCHGYRCDCSFSISDGPMSKGRLPLSTLEAGTLPKFDDPLWWKKFVVEGK